MPRACYACAAHVKRDRLAHWRAARSETDEPFASGSNTTSQPRSRCSVPSIASRAGCAEPFQSVRLGNRLFTRAVGERRTGVALHVRRGAQPVAVWPVCPVSRAGPEGRADFHPGRPLIFRVGELAEPAVPFPAGGRSFYHDARSRARWRCADRRSAGSGGRMGSTLLEGG